MLKQTNILERGKAIYTDGTLYVSLFDYERLKDKTDRELDEIPVRISLFNVGCRDLIPITFIEEKQHEVYSWTMLNPIGGTL